MHTQVLKLPGGTLAYTDYGGSGQPVIMLPGIGALRSEYRFLAPALQAAGFRAVALDLRGHGETTVPWQVYDVPSVGGDLLALLDHLGAGPAHLIGTSFGAAPAVWLAAERPDCARSVVLINPFVRTAKVNPLMGFIFWLMMNNPLRVYTWALYYASMYPSRKPDDFPEYLRQLKANLSQPGRFAAVAGLAFSPRQPSDERLEMLKAPALVIMGGRDPDFPDPAAEGRILAERTRGRLEVIAGAGHYPQTELPEQTARVVIDFLTGRNA